MIVCGMVVGACGTGSTREIVGEVMLLTRDGCANTEVLRGNLDAALASAPSGSPQVTVTVVDLDTLPETDVRRGYPTPTLLYANRDVFELPEPRPPLPQPT